MPPVLRRRNVRNNRNNSSQENDSSMKLKPKKLKKVRQRRKRKVSDLSYLMFSPGSDKSNRNLSSLKRNVNVFPSSEDSLPKWAENTFDRLRRGTMANLIPPPRMNQVNGYLSTSVEDVTTNTSKIIDSFKNSFIRKPVKPRRQYRNKKLAAKKQSLPKENITTLSEDDINKHILIISTEKSYRPKYLDSKLEKSDVYNATYSPIPAMKVASSTPIYKNLMHKSDVEYSINKFDMSSKSNPQVKLSSIDNTSDNHQLLKPKSIVNSDFKEIERSNVVDLSSPLFRTESTLSLNQSEKLPVILINKISPEILIKHCGKNTKGVTPVVLLEKINVEKYNFKPKLSKSLNGSQFKFKIKLKKTNLTMSSITESLNRTAARVLKRSKSSLGYDSGEKAIRKKIKLSPKLKESKQPKVNTPKSEEIHSSSPNTWKLNVSGCEPIDISDVTTNKSIQNSVIDISSEELSPLKNVHICTKRGSGNGDMSFSTRQSLVKSPYVLLTPIRIPGHLTNNISTSTPLQSLRKRTITPRKTLSEINVNTPPNGKALDTKSSLPVVLPSAEKFLRDVDGFVIPDGIRLAPGKKWHRSLSLFRRSIYNGLDRNDNNPLKGRNWRHSVKQVHSENRACLKAFAANKLDTKLDNENNDVSIISSNISLREKTSSRRFTVRIVEAPVNEPSREEAYRIGDDVSKKISDVACYVLGALEESGYVQSVGQNKIEGLEESFNNLCLGISKQVLETFQEPRSCSQQKLSARDVVLKRCNQIEPISFEDCYPDSHLQKCHKIGEGVYGEVFLMKTGESRCSVLKIIPIEGTQCVNGEHQKSFDEIITEIVIAQELSNLRHNDYNRTSCFTYVQGIRCVRGKYPERLVDLWELFDEDKGSENDHPSIFQDDQLYIILELEHGGRDLESYQFLTAEQSHAIFMQTAFALAAAENALQFEHRDLHWGNLLIRPTDEKEIEFFVNGETVTVPTQGVKATIIDFTLSRITYGGMNIYNNLADDPDLFKSVGDYQFEIYKLMQQKNKDEWEHFEPYTNVLWLHYVILKMVDGAHYKRTKVMKHIRNLKLMDELSKNLLTFQSTTEFVQLYYNEHHHNEN